MSVADLIGLNGTWLASYLLGLLVIVLFSYEQLNKRIETDLSERRLSRIAQLFLPEQLRNSRAFFSAYLFYCALLILIYSILSVGGASLLKLLQPAALDQKLAEVVALIESAQGALAADGSENGGSTPEGAALSQELSEVERVRDSLSGAESGLSTATAPLFFALLIVGLGPRTPILARIEQRIRELAHRIAGIPANFKAFTEALFNADVNWAEDSPGNKPDGHAAMVLLAASRGLQQERFTAFRRAAAKLYAFEAWRAGDPTWPSWRVRTEFAMLENEVAPVVQAILEDLDDLAARTPHDSAPGPDLEQNRSRWTAMAERVSVAAHDVCALFALYVERAESAPVGNGSVPTQLQTLIDKASVARAVALPQTDILITVLLSMALMMFLVGAVGSITDINPYPNLSHVGAGFAWAISVLALYGPASFMTWSARQAADARSHWRNAYDSEDVFPAAQYARLFLSAWFVAALSLFSWTMTLVLIASISHARDTGEIVAFRDIFARMFATDGAVLGQGWSAILFGLCGAFHACMMALIQDLVAANAKERKETDAKERGGTGADAARRPQPIRLALFHGLGLFALVTAINLSNGRWTSAETVYAVETRARDAVVEAAARAVARDRVGQDCRPRGGAPLDQLVDVKGPATRAQEATRLAAATAPRVEAPDEADTFSEELLCFYESARHAALLAAAPFEARGDAALARWAKEEAGYLMAASLVARTDEFQRFGSDVHAPPERERRLRLASGAVLLLLSSADAPLSAEAARARIHTIARGVEYPEAEAGALATASDTLFRLAAERVGHPSVKASAGSPAKSADLGKRRPPGILGLLYEALSAGIFGALAGFMTLRAFRGLERYEKNSKNTKAGATS